VERTEFSVGDRVRLSDLGRKNSRTPDRRGSVIAISRTGSSYRVRWADRKGADLVHWSFLEPDQKSVGG
jgi:hypothetical protein